MEIFEKDYLREAINSNASSSVCGFLYQFQRALFYIFSSYDKNTLVGVETLDDVAIISRDKKNNLILTLEQDKYTNRQTHNPISDRSSNLWHTLNIWLSNLQTYKSSYNEVNFYLTTNISLPKDSLALRISNAQSDTEIDNILSTIEFLSISTTNKDIIEISKYNENILRFVIKRIKVLDASTLPEDIKNIKDLTVQLFQLHSNVIDHADEIYEQLLGTLINQSFSKWGNKEQAWLCIQVFRDQLHSIQVRIPLIKYIDRDIFTMDFQHYMEESKDLNFISQLANLELPEDYIDDQLESYWGFYAERVRLQNEGYVLPTDWENRDRNLKARWKNITQQIEIEEIDNPSPKEKTKFRKILRMTLTHEFKEKLGGHETNHIYFTHGHYHDLVNSISSSNRIHWYKESKGK